jgi:ribokinase
MEGQKEYDICVVGSACVDFFFEVANFPQKGETISAKSFFDAAGGKGANQAVAASRLVGESLFAGQFGTDSAGDLIENAMKAAGVNMQYLRRLNDARTALGFVTLTESGQNAIIIVGGANMTYSDLTKLPQEYIDAIDRSKIVLLQREIPNEINTLVAKYAHFKGKLVVLDVGGRDEPFPEELLANIDYISPNETEIQRLIGPIEGKNIEETIRTQLLSKYPNMKVLLKLGADGCAVITRELYVKCGNITTYNRMINDDYKVVDVTGAGDCLMGSFFTKYSQLQGKVSDEELYERCMLFGNMCAYLCITQKGCIPAMPEAKTVEEFRVKYLSHLNI